MIPDKIYVGVGTLSSIQPAEEYAFPGWQEKPYFQIRNEEFIRKDTLIEWLRKEYKTASWYDEKMRHVTGCVGDTSSSGKAQAYKSVIDKLNSM